MRSKNSGLGRGDLWLFLAALPFLVPYLWVLLPETQPVSDEQTIQVSDRFARTFYDTVLFASASAGVAILVGGFFGLLAVRAGRWTRRLFFLLFLAILAVPDYVHAVGLISAGRYATFLDPLLFSFGGAFVVQGWALSPFVFLAVFAASLNWPKQWEEIALLDASSFRVFLRVRLGLALLPALTGGAVAWVLAYGDFTVPDLLFSRNTGQLRTLATEIQVVAGGYYDFHSARRLALLYLPLPLFAIVGMAAALWRLNLRRPLDEIGDGEDVSPPRGFSASSVLLWLSFGAAALPLAVSFSSLTAMWLKDAIALGTIWESASDEILNSLLLCSVCAILCVSAGVVLSFRMVHRTRGGATLVFFVVCALPFLLPGSLLGLAMLWAVNHEWLLGLRETVLPLAAVYLLIGPALAWPVVFQAHFQVPLSILDAAGLDGCGAFGKWRYVVAPFCWRAWVGAFGLAFLVYIGEAGAAMLVSAPGATPLSARILSVMHYGPGSYVAALCLLSAFFSLLLILALGLLIKGVGRGVR